MASCDILGNIAIIKSESEGKPKTRNQKLEQAKQLLKQPSIKTVLEKSTNVRGRLRTIKTKHLAGKKNLIATYKENNCTFKLNPETCYFSPRLSNERQSIAQKINPSQKVLIMFAGVGPFPIIIYKIAKPKKITAIELGRECINYFKQNLTLNKIPENRINIIQGDVKKKTPKEKYDVILMPRPNLKDTFLKQGLQASKRGTIIYYYAFGKENELEQQTKQLIQETKKLKRKIKIINTKKAGELAPYKHRWRVEIKVMN